jgi:BRCT domain type II-containing protein
VAGENMGPSKLEKATKNKVEILNESEFFKLLEELQANDKTKQFKQGELF